MLKVLKVLNTEVLSLYSHLALVFERFCTQQDFLNTPMMCRDGVTFKVFVACHHPCLACVLSYLRIVYMGFGIAIPTNIRESVDSLCRDGADTPISLNIQNPSKLLNTDILSPYRHLTLVSERFCTPKYP